jgi:hypothetical protein
MLWARRFATGLSRLRRPAPSGLSPTGFNPSRYVRNLFIFPLARKRLVCTLIGHRRFVRIAVFSFHLGSGWAHTCPRCGSLDRTTWEQR